MFRLLYPIKRIYIYLVVTSEKNIGITKEIFKNGKSFKIFGRELQGNSFVSLNYYLTSKNELLKPCEMPKEKVIHFLKNIKSTWL